MSTTSATLTNILYQLAWASLYSLLIFFITLAISIPLGLLVYSGRASKFLPIAWITQFYISVMRGTPLMLQLMMVYFGPYYIFGMQISQEYQFYAVIIAFGINYAAYFAEIYRGGFQSIPQGQREAAFVLGYSKRRTFYTIELPQMFRRVLPSITNEVITLVKDTSLAFVLGYTEMFTVAKQLAASQASMIPYACAAAFYYVFNLIVTVIMGIVEKRLSLYSI
ncbi:amino acid ABC transporter permease [Actinotignum urinale]|uniref:Amino acid ABC transporter permease n=1 Tax=Actinotignum urinale TaxID=190146 RepID=A0AAW9HMK4_9ACTO|nr:amino acid ABC transporter permease [Actinotignum urinale]MDY5128530.1 amino acid ABC transporter permease [Actinotignum urinale]MDY5132635.1 amino acid ABC transporter permease [Actinotignum urinale]MDY5151274.1 amino acid ABC transporter permease [Actinotignum urinale]MDY5155106.1 amino acid ABC transporter permease [Actinotignum urinale]MDY5160619.1 amino acid ABC transporter permease [Actinotignum urinale]